jgi:hypothetical protein
MKKISNKEWLFFIIVAIFSFGLWFKFSYPQFSFVDLSVDRKRALLAAESYLNILGVDTKPYLKSVVFKVDNWTDRYLQKTIGFKNEKDFIQQHNYELFSWEIQLFKQFQVEQYIIEISPQSGRVLSFVHLIEDTAYRKEIDKDSAKWLAEEFLRKNGGINFADYDFHEEKIKRYDNRTDYSFSWEKKGVYIPWKENEGVAKLLIGATVSGDEVRKFYKGEFDVPEKFRRYIENQSFSGDYLFSFHYLMLVFLIASSIFILLYRRERISIRFSQKWFSYLVLFLIIINLISIFNNFQKVISEYPTSTSLFSYMGIYFLKTLIYLTVFSIIIFPPGLAGEALRMEVFADKPYSSFIHYLRSTFYSRVVTRAILFGYILFFIILGLQSTIIYFGQKYLGVWKEWFNFTQFSSAYIPFLNAFIIGMTASLSEEVVFRLFGISWGKKYFKNTILAIIFTALIWGFGHAQYAIFPVWFRGIEVSILGLVFGFVFLRYGLIPLIVAHYLLDVFWCVCAYILGRSNSYLFGGSLFILMIPLIFAAFTYFINKEDREKEIKTVLNKIQRYNLEILINFVAMKKNRGFDSRTISEELILYNWDIELVNLAIKEVFSL